jgi:hypothetical protein
MALIFVATRWDGHLHDQKGCFQLQELRGKTYKVDTCSGKVESIDDPTPPPKVLPSPEATPESKPQ